MPKVILDVALFKGAFADRERMGIPLDEFAEVEPDPSAPYEFSFDDERDLDVCWGMGAWTVWQFVPLTLTVANRDGLSETSLFEPFKPLAELVGDDFDFARTLARELAWEVALGLLKEVNTYTYRTRDYMLSTAQDYRAGAYGGEYHAWQATFDANAIVFTTHPATPVPETTDWREDAQPGYWTGTASMPRSAQHENVAIHVYAPQFDGLTLFPYEPYTHAYFPQDHFDQVVTSGSWTFGKFQKGYIALYSFQPTEWVSYDPEVVATNGMVKPFDLRATVGPGNVWIVECGSKKEWGSFRAFRRAVRKARVVVTPAAKPIDGFHAEYHSPSRGSIAFGFRDPLVVNGERVPIRDYPRYDNPWAQVPHLAPGVLIAGDGVGVLHDFTGRGARYAYALD